MAVIKKPHSARHQPCAQLTTNGRPLYLDFHPTWPSIPYGSCLSGLSPTTICITLAFFCVLYAGQIRGPCGACQQLTSQMTGLLFCAAYALRAKWAVSFNFPSCTNHRHGDTELRLDPRTAQKVFDDLPFDSRSCHATAPCITRPSEAGLLKSSCQPARIIL